MLIDAIKNRRSIRKYKTTKIEKEKINDIKRLLNDAEYLNSNIKISLDIVEDGISFQNVLGGIVSSYGKIKAPHYIVGSTELVDNCYENIGYILESIVLKLTEMNIGTCWIGGGIKREEFKEFLSLDKSLNPIIVIAFGYPLAEDIKLKNTKVKRLPVNEICLGNYDEQFLNLMELVRIAPSSVNSQPWRYYFNKDCIDVYRIKNNIIKKRFFENMNKIDLGISLCHFAIAINSMNKKMRIVDYKKEYQKYIYYKTIILE